LASATKKRHGGEIDARVEINRESGEYQTFRRWLVVDDEDENFESPERQVLYARAQQLQPGIEVG